MCELPLHLYVFFMDGPMGHNKTKYNIGII